NAVRPTVERTAGGAVVRRVCRGAVGALLRGGDGASFANAGAVFSLAADRIFRRDCGGAWQRVAGGGFAGGAAISRTRADRAAARSLHDIAQSAAARGEDASSATVVGTA